MTRDRKALLALKRQEADDTFYADDAELQQAEQEIAQEYGRDAMERYDEDQS